jgi:nucleoid DNA-binding protein
MTLKYRVVPKVDPRDLEAPPKYYPTAVSSGHMDLRALAGRIAEISTVSTIDSPKELSDGKIVELGEFGAFRLTLQASGEELPEAAGTHNIKGARVQFRPGKGFKEVLKALNFKAL